jgi:hypothetical protein
MISREQAEAYQIVGDIFCKAFLVLVAALVFIGVTIVLVINPNLYLGIFDSVLAISIGPVMHHYFPKRKAH